MYILIFLINISFINIYYYCSLTKMYDMGIRKRQLKLWLARKPFCPKNILIAEPLSIHEATPIFILLGIFIALSFVICIMENLIHWMHSKG